jgi:predicted  nucleic acid-binding Zn-ribbon protein
MRDSFRDAVAALKETADALIAANLGIKKAADAVLNAREDYADVRETVERLETEVMDQGQRMREQSQEIRGLRQQIEDLRERLNGGAH